MKVADQQFVKGFLEIVKMLRKGIISDLTDLFQQDFQWKIREMKVREPALMGDLLGGKYVVMTFRLQREYHGVYHILFDAGEFLHLSRMMQVLGGDEAVEETNDRIATEEDMDAFREIGNQIGGSCNNVLRQKLSGTIHVSHLGIQLFEPERNGKEILQRFTESKHFIVHLEFFIGARSHPCDSFFIIPADLVVRFVEDLHRGERSSPSPKERPTGKRILIAYRSQRIRLKLKYFLEKHDFTVISCINMREMFQKLEDEKVDLLILDAILQKQSSIEICKKLRTHYSSRDLPILICSTVDSPAVVIESLKAGANDYLIVPFPASDLVHKVSKHL
jgi:CheY-like chemotaxis protein/chemotaxis protein CheY-P-specific phosphatase CheC